MTRLSHEQQMERFGVTFAEAHTIRDRAEAALTDAQLKAARRAWQDLAYEMRGGKGQPFQCEAHPERVRFAMLSALANGEGLDVALASARAVAGVRA